MNLLLLKAASYGFNQRCLTEEDFYQICEAENITVKENQSFTAYLTIDGFPYITLEKGLPPGRGLYAKFHELAHHFGLYGESPNQIFFMKSPIKDTKAEKEAHALAIIALCPVGVLNGSVPFDMEMRGECGIVIAKERRRIYDDFGV